MKGADNKSLLNRCKRVEGQVRGITAMLDSEKYCIDILTQIKAARSALKSLELEILENHMNHCVKDAVSSGSDKDVQAKVDEIMHLLRRSSKS
ncbi:metal-sensitive transcriptional regulator [Bacteriovorax sp. DB6_IX]|uniref:metal-sensitive transcriptional regulator n=1 Tax=Bacteriovorax sp. DB6_IX TaxID=1353530 RepID=UPI000389FC02|nr:metal-sensitive transcriptional regulator [Bacteriovorax sp. DB6_IX]EQC52439.1 metal-sensitive transcriptional repressor [Bacteriovorax sp. DB6_IX]